MIKGLLFWGYVDDSGVIHVKRYVSDRVIENYEKLPFCKGIFGPFEAYDIQQARQMCALKYQEIN